jgi:hypothetical protein
LGVTISPTAASEFVTRPAASNSARGHSSPVSGSNTRTLASAVPSAPRGIDGSRRMMTSPSVEP